MVATKTDFRELRKEERKEGRKEGKRQIARPGSETGRARRSPDSIGHAIPGKTNLMPEFPQAAQHSTQRPQSRRYLPGLQQQVHLPKGVAKFPRRRRRQTQRSISPPVALRFVLNPGTHHTAPFVNRQGPPGQPSASGLEKILIFYFLCGSFPTGCIPESPGFSFERQTGSGSPFPVLLFLSVAPGPARRASTLPYWEHTTYFSPMPMSVRLRQLPHPAGRVSRRYCPAACPTQRRKTLAK